MNEMKPRVLLVEDDAQLRAMLEELFVGEGYEVSSASDGQKGLHLALTGEFDVLVLDRGLPVTDGLNLLARLRREGVETAALILSALGNPADRVEGLDAGAEDYLAKPFDVDELLARLRALRRRHIAAATTLRITGGRFDLESRSVIRPDGSVVVLSERESALLEELARWPNRVFGRDEILEYVFPNAEEAGVVDTYVHYLRRKLGRGSVRTIHGVGYRIGTLA
ncbi:response regulator transcription factor [Arthrobacter sp. NPDC080073]|uniref:response regulator transcription factor n=1 Tax=Arthrobacter sp. NPDC080073 TaxID=3155919 RepID=UPI00344460B9